MNKQRLNKVFSEIKEKTGMDYAVTNADEYGDCNTCVNYGLTSAFGENSTGIFTKKWLRGMNASGPWKDESEVFIGHDITEEQAKIMVEVLQKNGYAVIPEEYNPARSFLIKEGGDYQ